MIKLEDNRDAERMMWRGGVLCRGNKDEIESIRCDALESSRLVGQTLLPSPRINALGRRLCMKSFDLV